MSMLTRHVRIRLGFMMVLRPETLMVVLLDPAYFLIFLHRFPKTPFCPEMLFQFRVVGMEWVIYHKY